MANDRIFIRCRGCGKVGLLAKYYPSNHGVWDQNKLSLFIENHMECSPHFGGPHLRGDRCFDLYAESSSLDFKHKLLDVIADAMTDTNGGES
jgi:hypothetical protein